MNEFTNDISALRIKFCRKEIDEVKNDPTLGLQYCLNNG
jgi:hypothetical protein